VQTAEPICTHNDAVWSKEVRFGIRVFTKLRLGVLESQILIFFSPECPIPSQIDYLKINNSLTRQKWTKNFNSRSKHNRG
jgi:hypothetical protein